MKIGIIGAGTASAVSALSIFHRIKELKADISVYCIYDPEIPIAQVGESGTNSIVQLLYEVLNFDIPNDLNNFDGTLRWATKYFWEDANNKIFKAKYGSPGIHLNSEKFSKYVFNQISEKYNNFTEIKDSVSSIIEDNKGISVICKNNIYEFDFLIDCTGTPTKLELDSEAYKPPDFNSVNSVILYPDFKEYNEEYTSAYVHKNGWMFGVPLQHRKAFGYLYNNNFTSEQEAAKHFAELKNINTDTLRKFSWRPYYKVEAMVGRKLSMGNKLYFFEPHQAIPLHYYINLSYKFFDCLVEHNNLHSLNRDINEYHSANMEEIQDLIAFNYQGENKLNSDFWTYAKENAVARLKSSKRFNAWYSYKKEHDTPRFWCHGPNLMNDYIDGFGINKQL